MFKAAFSCAWRVLSSWGGGLGAVISLGGTILQSFDKTLVFPGWAILAIGAFLLFATAVHLEWELLHEKEKSRKPRPDMRLLDVVQRFRGKPHVFGDGETIEIVRAFTRIKELALNNEITVFGAPGIEYLPEGGDVDAVLPRHPIPTEDWKDHSLSLMDFLNQPRCGRVQNDDCNKRPLGNGYGYIWFDRRQIDSIWPSQRRKLGWRNPIKVRTPA